MNADLMRQTVISKFNIILGRNTFSRSMRGNCYTKYKGKYYSNSSVAVCSAYEAAGYGFGDLTISEMCDCPMLKEVEIHTKRWRLLNIEDLRIGDILVFAGCKDIASGCVGMLCHIGSGSAVMCSHVNGKPDYYNLDEFMRRRYSIKTKTDVGHTGLIKVLRRISDEDGD